MMVSLTNGFLRTAIMRDGRNFIIRSRNSRNDKRVLLQSRLLSSLKSENGKIEAPSHLSSADESRHKKIYSIRGMGKRGPFTESVTNTGHELRTDVPKRMGGGDAAPQPVEHLLAALIGCTQATAMYVGRSMKPRLNIEKIEFDLRAERDERGALEQPIDVSPSIPSRLSSVGGTVIVYLRDNESISDEILQLLAKQTEHRCPVANMMTASGCKMDIIWIDGSTVDEINA